MCGRNIWSGPQLERTSPAETLFCSNICCSKEKLDSSSHDLQVWTNILRLCTIHVAAVWIWGQLCEYSYSPPVMQQYVTGSQKSGADFFVLKKFIDFVLLTSHQKHRLKKKLQLKLQLFSSFFWMCMQCKIIVELEIQVRKQEPQYVSSELC